MLTLGVALGSLVAMGAAAPAPAAPRPASPITHVVEIMLENHTFDNLFGAFPGAAGIPPDASVANPNATFSHADNIKPFTGGLNQGSVLGQIDNSGNGELAAMDYRPHGGYQMDLFSFFPRNGLASITGVDPRLDPDAQALARNFELLDHNFQPVIAPTVPNVITALTGYAHGWMYNDEAPPSVTYNSIFDELSSHGRSWGLYYGLPPAHILQTWWRRILPAGHEKDVKFTGDFLTDVKAGNLPNFSMVRPGVGYSGEPPEDIQPSDAWAGQLVQAVMDSPLWKSTAIYLTWDEGGGYWDHMKPPSPTGEGYGTRTASVIISPWVRRGVNHHVTTNLSILSFMQHMWHLPALSALNRRQDDLGSAFDFHRRPLAPVKLPVAPPDTLYLTNDSHSYEATPGRPFTFTVQAMTAGLAKDSLSGPVTLTAVAPAGGAPARIPGTVTLNDGAATVTATFPAKGFYRVSALGPAGSQGWMTINAGADWLTP